MNNLNEIVEALIFSVGNSISKKEILEKLPDVKPVELDNAINSLKEKYSGDSGIVLLTFNNKVQLASNPKYGDVLADALLPTKERMLSKTLLEVLGIIAYKQPVTRLEIEEIRTGSANGSSSSEYGLTMLLKFGLIEVVGRKDTVGRPVLYATTDEFLKKFNLDSLAELPDYEQLLERIRILEDTSTLGKGLFKEVQVDENGEYVGIQGVENETIQEELPPLDEPSTLEHDEEDFEFEDEETPDFLEGEEVEIIE